MLDLIADSSVVLRVVLESFVSENSFNQGHLLHTIHSMVNASIAGCNEGNFMLISFDICGLLQF